MKKLLLGLGSIAAVVAPIAAVVSCGSDDLNLGDQGTGSGDGTNTGGAAGTAPSEQGTEVADTTKVSELKQTLVDSGFVTGLTAAQIKSVRSADNFSWNTNNINNLVITADHAITFVINAPSVTVNGGTTHTTNSEDVTLTIFAVADDGDKTDEMSWFLTDTDGAFGDHGELSNTASSGSIAGIKNTLEVLFEKTGYLPASGTGTGSGSTGGSGTGTGTGSGSTGTGTGTVVAAKDLTAGTMKIWHDLFHVGGAKTLPADNTKLSVTAGGETITYTWKSADTTALSGFTAGTMTQDEVINYLAKQMAGAATGTVTADQVKTAFGISSATLTSHTHPFTTGTAGAPVVTAENLSTDLAKFADATSTLDATALATAVTAGTITPTALGFTAPSSALTNGVTATFAVKTPFAAGKVVLSVTLAKAGASSVTNNTKDITITAAAAAPVATNLSSYAPSAATSSKNEAALQTDLGTKTTVTADELGFTEPANWATDKVTATYTITAYTATGTGPITVNFVLAKAGASTVTGETGTFVLTPKAAAVVNPPAAAPGTVR